MITKIHNVKQTITRALSGFACLLLLVSGSTIAAPALAAAAQSADPGLQRILTDQICPALKTIKGQKLSGKYCKQYKNQKDLDQAESKICGKYGKQLKHECDAYTSTATALSGAAAPAATCSASKCDLVSSLVVPAINLLSTLFGLVAAISLILGGIQYTTAEGDPQKVTKAKSRLTNTIFAILAYAMLYSFFQFLVPGGVFNH